MSDVTGIEWQINDPKSYGGEIERSDVRSAGAYFGETCYAVQRWVEWGSKWWAKSGLERETHIKLNMLSKCYCYI